MRVRARAREYRKNLQTAGRGKRVRPFAETSAEKVFRKPTGFKYSEKGIDFAAKKRYNWRESVHENKNTVS